MGTEKDEGTTSLSLPPLTTGQISPRHVTSPVPLSSSPVSRTPLLAGSGEEGGVRWDRSRGDPDLAGTFTVTHKAEPHAAHHSRSALRTSDDLLTLQRPLAAIEVENERPRAWSFGGGPVPQVADRLKSRSGSEVSRDTPPSARRNSPAWASLRDSRGNLCTMLKKTGRDGKERSKSLISVVGLVVFKKLYAAELAKIAPKITVEQVDDDSSDDYDSGSEEEADDVGSSLEIHRSVSSEALVASLTCYEDKLADTISKEVSPRLRRKQSPCLPLVAHKPSNISEVLDSDCSDQASDLGVTTDKRERLSKYIDKGMGLLDNIKSGGEQVGTSELNGRSKSAAEKHTLRSFKRWSRSWRREVNPR